MKHIYYTLLFVLSIGLVSAAQVDFAANGAGTSIEGVNINGVTVTSTGNTVVLIKDDNTAATYGAPNGAGSTLNGCLPGTGGFADIEQKHEYDLNFSTPVNEFSLVMYDFGDYNPSLSKNHQATLYAFDSNGVEVNSSTLSYTSDGKLNPKSSPTYGNLWYTGDACDAATDYSEPGLWNFTVSGEEISYVQLRVEAGIDPNIAFGFATYKPVLQTQDVCEGESYELLAGQHIEVGNVNVTDDGDNISVTYSTKDGWMITETHLDVTCSVDTVASTKKGSPIPGQFTHIQEHDPAVSNYTYEFTLPSCDGDLTIAAHAVVQKEIYGNVTYTVNMTENFTAPFYADTVVSSSQGLEKDGSPVATERSVPEQGLDLETDRDPSNFFSLGFGGELVASFTCPLTNGEGDDIRIVEDTWGTYPLERAEVFLSYDGNTWSSIGFADNTVRDPIYNIHTTTGFDITGFEGAQYIKIVDVSDPDDFGGRNSADGYDLNAIEALQDCSYTYQVNETRLEVIDVLDETAWSDGERFVERGNWATYSTYGVCFPEEEPESAGTQSADEPEEEQQSKKGKAKGKK